MSPVFSAESIMQSTDITELRTRHFRRLSSDRHNCSRCSSRLEKGGSLYIPHRRNEWLYLVRVARQEAKVGIVKKPFW